MIPVLMQPSPATHKFSKCTQDSFHYVIEHNHRQARARAHVQELRASTSTGSSSNYKWERMNAHGQNSQQPTSAHEHT